MAGLCPGPPNRGGTALCIGSPGQSPEMTSSDGSNLMRCRVFFRELLFIGRLITRDLGFIRGEIAEARRIVGIARLVNLVQIELACV